MSRHLAFVGIVTLAGFILLLIGMWVIPRISLCMLFCPIIWN